MRSREKPSRPSALRTRERLLAAGRKAFADKGLGGVSLREDILAAAGVSSGSFYHQFADKEDLLLEILRRDGAAVVETLYKGGVSRGLDASANPRHRLLLRLFDMAERSPEFVKIYVREYYSDSAAVRREIRRHRDRTIAQVKAHYDDLRNATGVPLDTDAIATFLSVQLFALVNYYLDFPNKERAEARAQLIRSALQFIKGGVFAVRAPTEH